MSLDKRSRTVYYVCNFVDRSLDRRLSPGRGSLRSSFMPQVTLVRKLATLSPVGQGGREWGQSGPMGASPSDPAAACRNRSEQSDRMGRLGGLVSASERR